MLISTSNIMLPNQNTISRWPQHIGAILFGIYLSASITDSVFRGLSYLFVDEVENWGFAFWGDHYLARIIASIIGTFLGTYSSGIISKTKGNICGVLSSIPTSLFWIVILFFVFKYGEYQIMPISVWVTIFSLIIFTPIIGYFAGISGASFRNDSPELFEVRKNTIIGIKWYHWIWLFPVFLWSGAFFTYSFYQGLYLFYTFDVSKSFFSIINGFLGIIVLISLVYLLIGVYKTLQLLIIGYKLNLSSAGIANRIVGWTVGIWLIVGILQAIVSYFFINKL